LSAARNDGAAAAKSDLLLFTDDDCLVEEGWVESWCALFAAHPDAGIGFGPVRPPAPDRPGTITPAFDPGATVKTYTKDIFRRRGLYDIGMGANMALRRLDWLAIGGFDECLGAGARFPGAEEDDAAYRIVKLGRELVHVPAPAVIHLGTRSGDASWQLYSGYARAKGATLVKFIRCRDAFAWEVLGRDILRLSTAIIRGVLTGRRPLGLRYLRWYLLGALEGLSVAVNAETRVFLPKATQGSLISRGRMGDVG
jgi:GT2 family glycosyltransferase